MNSYKIYKHTTPSGWVYIGQTCRPVEERWKQGYSCNRHLIELSKNTVGTTLSMKFYLKDLQKNKLIK